MMYRRLQKTLSSEELLPPLWDKCKVCSDILSRLYIDKDQVPFIVALDKGKWML